MNHDFVLTTTIGLLHSTLREVNQKLLLEENRGSCLLFLFQTEHNKASA